MSKNPILNFTARNEVFIRMFENKEMKEVKEGHVEIQDISNKAVEWFFRYLYNGVLMGKSGDTEGKKPFPIASWNLLHCWQSKVTTKRQTYNNVVK